MAEHHGVAFEQQLAEEALTACGGLRHLTLDHLRELLRDGADFPPLQEAVGLLLAELARTGRCEAALELLTLDDITATRGALARAVVELAVGDDAQFEPLLDALGQRAQLLSIDLIGHNPNEDSLQALVSELDDDLLAEVQREVELVDRAVGVFVLAAWELGRRRLFQPMLACLDHASRADERARWEGVARPPSGRAVIAYYRAVAHSGLHQVEAAAAQFGVAGAAYQAVFDATADPAARTAAAEMLAQQAVALASGSELAQARQALSQALDIDRDAVPNAALNAVAELQVQHANRYRYIGREDEALEAYADAIRLLQDFVAEGRLGRLPALAGALLERGTLYERLGRQDEALADYAAASRLYHGRPQAGQALLKQVDPLRRLGRGAEAWAAVQEAVARTRELGDDPETAGGLAEAGRLALRLDRPDEAEVWTREAWELASRLEAQGEPLARRHRDRAAAALAVVLMGHDRADEALSLLAQALVGQPAQDDDPQTLAAHLNLHVLRANLLVELGYEGEAMDDARAFLAGYHAARELGVRWLAPLVKPWQLVRQTLRAVPPQRFDALAARLGDWEAAGREMVAGE